MSAKKATAKKFVPIPASEWATVAPHTPKAARYVVHEVDGVATTGMFMTPTQARALLRGIAGFPYERVGITRIGANIAAGVKLGGFAHAEKAAGDKKEKAETMPGTVTIAGQVFDTVTRDMARAVLSRYDNGKLLRVKGSVPGHAPTAPVGARDGHFSVYMTADGVAVLAVSEGAYITQWLLPRGRRNNPLPAMAPVIATAAVSAATGAIVRRLFDTDDSDTDSENARLNNPDVPSLIELARLADNGARIYWKNKAYRLLPADKHGNYFISYMDGRDFASLFYADGKSDYRAEDFIIERASNPKKRAKKSRGKNPATVHNRSAGSNEIVLLGVGLSRRAWWAGEHWDTLKSKARRYPTMQAAHGAAVKLSADLPDGARIELHPAGSVRAARKK